jgi:putative ABC transport system substrate-binding protein
MRSKREFIALLGGAAAWPVAARAQQGRMRRVGILMAYRPSDGVMLARVQAMQQELQRLGWTRGANIQFDERWTTDDLELIRANAANLVDLNSDIIVATGGRVIPVFIQLTRSIPMIIPGIGDPTAGQVAQVLYPVTKERGACPHFQVVDVAVQGLVHSEDELRHATKSPPQARQNNMSRGTQK